MGIPPRGVALDRPILDDMVAVVLRWDFEPGALSAGSSVTVETGWHYTDGEPALDFTPEGSVWIRGYAFTSQPLLYNNSYALLYTDLSTHNCTIVRADIYEAYNVAPSSYGGTEIFEHVTKNSVTSLSFSHSDGGQWNDVQIGTMINPENAGCKPTYWTGPHLHQSYTLSDHWGDPAQGAFSKNTYYPEDPNYTKCPCGTVQNNDPTKWVHRLTW